MSGAAAVRALKKKLKSPDKDCEGSKKRRLDDNGEPKKYTRAELTELLEQVDAEVVQLTEQLKTLTAEAEKVRCERNQLSCEKAQLRTSLEDSRRSEKRAKDSEARMMTQHSAAQEERRKASMGIPLLETRNQLNLNSAQHFMKKYKFALTDNEKLTEALDGLKDQRALLTEERDGLRKALHEVTQERDGLKEALDATTQERDSLLEECDTMIGDYKWCKADRDGLWEKLEFCNEELERFKENCRVLLLGNNRLVVRLNFYEGSESRAEPGGHGPESRAEPGHDTATPVA